MSLVISLLALFIAFVALWFSNQITKSAEKSVYRMTSKELVKFNETLEKQQRDLKKAQALIKSLKASLSELEGKTKPSASSPSLLEQPDSTLTDLAEHILNEPRPAAPQKEAAGTL